MRLKLKLKKGHRSKLGFVRIEILTPNFEAALIDSKLLQFHLCNTDIGLITISAQDLLRDLEHYQKMPSKKDLSHTIRGDVSEFQ